MKNGNLAEKRTFHWKDLNTPQWRHLYYLLFWPVYGIFFLTVERLWIRDYYYPIHCALDDLIPLCEYFLIPYLFWFVFLVGMVLYTMIWEKESFVGFMKFIIVSYSLAVAVYMIFPNCQELRPVEFVRDNLFTRFLAGFYQFDTNTNVCPSIHVIGSVAVAVCAWKSPRFSAPLWRTVFSVTALLISVSTVFLKQHSVIDLLAAVPVCVIAYFAAYGTGKRREKRK